MRDLLVMFKTPEKKPKRHTVLKWLKEEFERYADKKYPEPIYDETWMREGGFDQGSEWERQVTQYWARARVLGLDTPAGRQCMLKSVTTLIDACAAMIAVHGEPPLPGYPSGEVHISRKEQQWQRDESRASSPQETAGA